MNVSLVNNLKLIMSNPLRRDPLFKAKLKNGTVVYRYRNDDSIYRIVGGVKIDGYNPQTREYDVMLEETMVHYFRRYVTDCISGDMQDRIITRVDANELECILTNDLLKEIKTLENKKAQLNIPTCISYSKFIDYWHIKAIQSN